MKRKIGILFLLTALVLISAFTLAACNGNKEFTVTFDGNDGTLVGGQEVQKVKQGEQVIAPVYEKEGYTLYWDGSFDNVTANVTIKAVWTVNQYTISFESDGGNTVSSITQDYDTNVTAPANPMKTSYTFDGWYTGDNTIYTFGKMPAKNIQLFAKWTTDKYTYIFYDEDGTTELKKETVDYGSSIVAPDDSTKEATAQYTYTFSGWDKTIPATITENIIFTATYSQTTNQYTYAFYDEDGATILKTDTVDYGSEIAAPADPVKVSTAQYTYVFSGWDKTIPATITENIIFTATYSQTTNQYTYTFYDEDGTTILKTDTVDYGSEIAAPADPTKAATAQYTYTFGGWDKDIPDTLTENITFAATYSHTVNKYIYTFLNEDGTELKRETVDYGSAIVSPENPTKAATAQYTYTFCGWDKDIPDTLTANITFTATYSQTVNKYIYTFLNEDGTELKRETVDYGSAIVSPENPTKAATAQYTYTFGGWDKVIPDTITENITFTATYSHTVNKYIYTFLNEDGTELKRETVDYGSAIVSPENPTKAATAQYTYTFGGWDKDIPDTLTANITFTATYSQVINQYTYTFISNGGSGVAAVTADYGAQIDAPAQPERTGYVFGCWFADDGTFVNEVIFPAQITIDCTLYAKWTEHPGSHGLKYALINSDSKYEVTGYEGGVADIIIPLLYEGKPVTSIGESAFEKLGIISVVLGGNITTIGCAAFYDCPSLSNVIIPGSVTRIEAYAFVGCHAFTEIIIPDSVTFIGEYAFSGCRNAEDIIIGSSVEIIERHAFKDCDNLFSIVIPNSVITIGETLFTNTPIKQIYCGAESKPASWHENWNHNNEPVLWGYDGAAREYNFITNGGDAVDAVTDCYPISAPAAKREGYRLLGWYDNSEFSGEPVAFPYYSKTKTTLYAKWVQLFTITFDPNGGSAVAAVTADHNSVIAAPANPSKEHYTFCGWFTDNGTFLEPYTFTVIIQNLTLYAKWEHGTQGLAYTLINGDTEYEVSGYSGSAAKVVIPDLYNGKSVTSIGESAFEKLGITSVVIGGNVTNIGFAAFYDCSSLSNVIISHSVTVIGGYTFVGCGAFTEIIIPDSVIFIGEYAFASCRGAGVITIGNNVATIESYAFKDCDRLFGIIIPNSVITIGEYLFYNTPTRQIYCETDAKPAGWQENWNSGNCSVTWGYDDTEREYCFVLNGGSEASATVIAAVIMQMPLPLHDTLSFAGWYDNPGFSGKPVSFPYYSENKLTLYALWEEVDPGLGFNLINNGKEYEVTGYTGTKADIIIPGYYRNKPVTSIGSSAFLGLSGLLSVSIPNSVTRIRDFAFNGCGNLVSVTFDENSELISIGKNVFIACSSLTTFAIPNSLTSIDDAAFVSCSSLTYLIIPYGVTHIGSYAFDGSENLTLYCQASTKPAGWVNNWNNSGLPVYWAGEWHIAGGVTEPHSWGEWFIVTPPTCAENGLEKRICSICGHEETREIPVIDHDFGEWGNSTATETKDGIETRVCRHDPSHTETRIAYATGTPGLDFTPLGDNTYSVSKGTATATEIFIPAFYNRMPVIKIGNHAFKECSFITKITLPDSIKIIDGGAFWLCTNLISINIPDGVTTIGNAAFASCPKLTSLVIPLSVITIDGYAFNFSAGLTLFCEGEVKPAGWVDLWNASNLPVHWAGDWGFVNGIPKLYNTLKFNGNGATAGNMEEIRILAGAAASLPYNFFTKDGYAFMGWSLSADGVKICDDGGSYTMGTDAICTLYAVWDSVFEYRLTDTDTYAIAKYKGNQGNVVIPSTHNGKGVSDIDYRAFAGFKNLYRIVIPGSIKNIGDSAFESCNNLSEAILGEGVEYIGIRAFIDCKINIINIPSTIIAIGRRAFSGCDFAEEIVLPGNVSIGESAFQCCNMKKVTFSSGIPSIGAFAFELCTNLTEIIIPDGVTNIGNGAFSLCYKLTKIVIPASVIGMGEFVFNNGYETVNIFCKISAQPSGWDVAWNPQLHPVYWSGQWHYDIGGNPVPN